MFEGNLYKQIVPLLGWTALNRAKEYAITNESGEVIDNVRLRSFWIGEIIHLQHQLAMDLGGIFTFDAVARGQLLQFPGVHLPGCDAFAQSQYLLVALSDIGIHEGEECLLAFSHGLNAAEIRLVTGLDRQRRGPRRTAQPGADCHVNHHKEEADYGG